MTKTALLTALLVLAAGASVAADFTVDDLFRTRLVTEARISPDGEMIAYVLSVPRDPYADDDGPAWQELHVVGPEPDRDRAFIAGEVSVSKIAWTPDGRHIAFLAKRGDDEHKALYTIPMDGGEARQMLSHAEGIREYAMAPDGSRVTFLVKDAEDETRKKRAEKGFKAEAFEENPRFVRVHVADVGPDGMAGEPRLLELAGSATQPVWSPDGLKLAVALAPTPSVDDGIMKRRVHVVDAATGEVLGVVETAGKIGKVAWSPDGSHLALIAAAHENDPNAGRLMVAPATGGAPRDLRPDWTGDAVALAFISKKTVAYVAHENLETMLVRQDIDGGKPKIVVESGGPALRSIHFSGDGKHAAVIADAPDHAREVFAWHGKNKLYRLTDSNPWLADVDLARQEVVRFPARDGLEIDGLFLHPLNAGPGPHPLVVMVHGGPESHYSDGWITRYVTPGQVLAARGFAVFYPNYRGSTGRGVDFSMASQGDYGGGEFNDLVDGIAYLAERGLVDPDRVGVTGGSYGGFASAWCATALSEHFKASVMFVGVSDHVSKFGTTNIPNEMYLVHARTWPWDNWDHYRERSPIFHAEKHRTPLLIMHGKDDPRVHPSQSLIMYRYLKTLDQAPVRLVWYPGEGHGNRKAAARLDYASRLVRWMEHYVTGSGGEMPTFDLDLDTARLGELHEETP